jgi:SAM-dependent methyltransferase
MSDQPSSKAWDWSRVPAGTWMTASDEFLPVAFRWHDLGKRNVLDLGCGRGRHAFLLAQMGFSVTAADLSPEGIKQLRKAAAERGIRNIDTLVCDMLAIPLPDSAFDGVLAFNSIYHTDYPGLKKVIAEIFRLLKPGGRFFGTLNSKSNPAFADTAYEILDGCTIIKRGGLEDGIPHTFLDYAEVVKLLGKFNILKAQHVQDFRNKRSRFCYYVEAEKPDI